MYSLTYIKAKPIIRLLLLALSLGAVMVGLVYTGYLRFNYPSGERYPVQGIDVSHHQKEIEWDKVKGQGIAFAFIKATEGGDFKDEAFKKNWEGAKAHHIDVGAYHFFTFCKSGEAQARNFMETVPLEKGSLPPVIDLEYGGNCKLTKSKEEVLREIAKMESILSKKYGKRAILYVTKAFYEHYLIGQFPDNPIWYRSVFHPPKIVDKRTWHFWQYGNRGHLKGIKGYVDLNVFYGNREKYEDFKK